MKTSISKKEYHQLLGLKVLADKHNQSMHEIVAAAKELVGDADKDYSHMDDWAWGSRETDEVLRLMKVEVRKDGKSLRHNKRTR